MIPQEDLDTAKYQMEEQSYTTPNEELINLIKNLEEGTRSHLEAGEYESEWVDGYLRGQLMAYSILKAWVKRG